MGKKLIHIVPFYLLLVPLFYVLHAYNAYFGLFQLRYPVKYFFLYLGIACVLFLISYFLYRNRLKAGLMALALLLVFLFFGKLHDTMKGIRLPAFFLSYTFVLPFLLFVFILLARTLKRSEKPLKANFYFNILFIVLVTMELGSACWHLLSGDLKKKNLATTSVTLPVTSLPDSLKPDIFFIVFDEYTSSRSLQKYLSFDNHLLDSALLADQFFIADSAHSNYNSTPFSLGSTFNLEFLTGNFEHQRPVPQVMLQAEYSFTQSFIPRFLKSQGYTIHNLGILDLDKAPAPQPRFFQEEYQSAFYEETLWNRLDRDIGWNIRVRFPQKLLIKPTQERQAATLKNNQENINRILTELGSSSRQPKFVYGHIFMPHRPYIVNQHGELNRIYDNYEAYSRDSLYLQQLQFCNKWIQSLATASNKKSVRPRVVIIEGDHGYRDADDEKMIRERELMNLSAFYFSDHDYSTLYKSITPINTFRVVLNKYFNSRLPLVNDSTVLLISNSY